jgi:hypothetical protein
VKEMSPPWHTTWLSSLCGSTKWKFWIWVIEETCMNHHFYKWINSTLSHGFTKNILIYVSYLCRQVSLGLFNVHFLTPPIVKSQVYIIQCKPMEWLKELCCDFMPNISLVLTQIKGHRKHRLGGFTRSSPLFQKLSKKHYFLLNNTFFLYTKSSKGSFYSLEGK